MIGGETVIHEPWVRDEKNAHGQKSPVFSSPVSIPDTGVDVPDSSEPRDGLTENARWDYRLYPPAGTTVGPRDRLTIRGHECAVEEPGEPITHMFTGAAFRTEVLARRVS